VLGILGPPLVALAGVPLRSQLGLAGFLFATLLVVIVVAVIGGLRPAIATVAVGFLAGAVFFARPYGSLRVYLQLDNVPLVGFVVVGATIAILVNELALVAEEQADLRQVEAALRRVATLVARGAPARDLFAAATAEVGQLLPVERAGMGRLEPDGTVTILSGWSRVGEQIDVGSRSPLGEADVGTVVAQTGRPARTDSHADGAGWVEVVFGGAGIRSAIGAPITVEARLWGVMIAGSILDVPLPPDTGARLAGFTELLATAIANAESRGELAASRARIVAAADETRRRIERDLHDGAQQRLVSLGLGLRAAQMMVPPELAELDGELSRVAGGLSGVMGELREMARGIHPAILAEGGLGPALRTLGRRSGIPVELDLRADARFPDRVEVAAYYVASETLTNAAKHAGASVARVRVEVVDEVLRVTVSDDGTGGADPTRGSGLVGLRDRVEALGGTITLDSPRGAGTTVAVALPLGD
jgi:signal transduction histidine kinase